MEDKMWYLGLLAFGVAAIVVWFFFKKALDVNGDGKVDVADAKIVADINKDGKVDIDDVKAVKAAALEVVTEAKEVAAKVEETVVEVKEAATPIIKEVRKAATKKSTKVKK
jgi:hypothetical protein